jgi:hypothetical protein
MANSKIKKPVTFKDVVRLALPGRSKKFRRDYLWWHEGQRFWHKNGRKPMDEEIKKHIADDVFRYDEDAAKREAQQIQNWLPIFLKETSPNLTVTDADFPMKFKECLRRVIGGRSYGYNLPIFKAYWRHLLKSTAIQNGYPAWEQTDEFIETRTLAFIERLKTERVDQGWFKTFAAQIPDWRQAHRINPQRKDAAIWRWLRLEENRIKLLTVLAHRINALSHPKKPSKVKVRIKKMSISHRKKSRK